MYEWDPFCLIILIIFLYDKQQIMANAVSKVPFLSMSWKSTWFLICYPNKM